MNVLFPTGIDVLTELQSMYLELIIIVCWPVILPLVNGGALVHAMEDDDVNRVERDGKT